LIDEADRKVRVNKLLPIPLMKVYDLKNKKAKSPFRQPGYLIKTRGIPSLLLSRFGFIKSYLEKMRNLKNLYCQVKIKKNLTI
jgi:hypothetical protein